MESQWRGVCFEGGGVKGLAYVGVIKVLHDMNILSQITHVSGSSAGSLIATLVACRVSYENIKESCLNLNYSLFQDSSWFIPTDIYHLVENLGWNPGEAMIKIYGDIVEKYIGNRLITFGQIREKYNTTLIITSTDVGLGSTVYYSPDSHPDMPVIEAARQSCSIPVFYYPVIKDGHMYVDGGLLNNYPIQVLYKYLNKAQVFGAKLISDDDSEKNHKLPNNLNEYLMKIIKILMDQAAKIHIDDYDWKRTIKIDTGKIKTTQFNLTEIEKLWLIDQGEIASKEFFIN